MRVLFGCKSMAIENLGVMYLASVVKEHGHEARICELKDIYEVVREWDPAVVGFSVMTGDQRAVNRLCMNLKETNSQLITVVGGPHPTFFPKDFSYADYVVKGEAENWISGFLLGHNAIEQVQGGGGMCALKPYTNIDSIPWPDRTDFKDHRIRDFISSRGCPYNCTYCYNDTWAKMHPHLPRVRTRSVDNVIEEIISADPTFVYFQDSCFAVNTKWLEEFSLKYRSLVDRPFHCHARPDQVDQNYVLALKDAGCRSIRIALESASPRLRELLNRKNTNLDKVAEAVKLFKKWGIEIMVQNMIGLPTGTIEDDLQTLEFNIRVRPSYAWVSIFAPYPGTKLGDDCLENGWYDGDYSDITDNFFDTSYLTIDHFYRKQLECLQKIFALCVEIGYMPTAEELTHNNFQKLVHKIMRAKGDFRLYGYDSIK